VIPYRTNQFIQTTIGQLNFFKWMLDNGILDYIQEHYECIEKDMMLRNTTKPKTEKNRKKREELSVFASKTIKKEVIEIELSFD
jgi:phage antirepressor YoqD-like protein